MQVSRSASDYWVSRWVAYNDDEMGHNDSVFHTLCALFSTHCSTPQHCQTFYLFGFIAIAILNSFMTLARAFLYAFAGYRAARRMFEQLLTSVLQAPMCFFDAQPLGRLINRFGNDVFGIDEQFPFSLNILLAQLFGMLGLISLVAVSSIWYALLLLPILAMSAYVQNQYRAIARGNTTTSPYHHLHHHLHHHLFPS